ncbi:hypothetical protein V6K52_19880 [Knoellia sp. S7-12]
MSAAMPDRRWLGLAAGPTVYVGARSAVNARSADGTAAIHG